MPDVAATIEQILRIRRLEADAEPATRAELRKVREFLEAGVGQTVKRMEAARVLKISHTALDRWVASGEIPSVLTPQGRREVPLRVVIDLLEDVESVRAQGVQRAVAAVMKGRERRAQELDLERLFPPKPPRSHRVPELQSLAYHRLVADRLDAGVVDAARERLARWRSEGRIDPRWAEEWARVLDLPQEEIAKEIAADTSTASALRQTSPFVGVVSEQERRRLLKAARERA